MAKKNNTYVADFETTTTADDCRVWGWGISRLDNPFVEMGETIEDFFKVLIKGENKTVYFHNLAFDGIFILDFLLRRGYEVIGKKAPPDNKTIKTLIGEQGQFYSIEVFFVVEGHRTKKVKFLDSLKVLPFSVAEIAKAFGLPISKLSIDYDEYRSTEHKLTDVERSYIEADILIVVYAINYLYDNGMDRMTTAGNALAEYKHIVGERNFKNWFPILDTATFHDIRPAYKGGYTYLKRGQEGEHGKGIVLDVNSMYPHVLRNKPLPYGEPVFFNGKYKTHELYPLYIQAFTCKFKVKRGFLPTIQIKESLRFVPTDYLESSDNEDVTLVLSNVDLDIFFRHYDVYNIQWHSGYMFKASDTHFISYIDKWFEKKTEAKLQGNKPLMVIAKLMLNTLYGKFGSKPEDKYKEVKLEDDRIKLESVATSDERPTVYLPVAIFVTSYAHEIIINGAQSQYQRFIYCDTDSLHIKGTKLPRNLSLSSTELGAFDIEKIFFNARFLHAKSYIEYARPYGSTESARIYVTCAGMSKRCYPQVRFNNFKVGGRKFTNNLKGKIVSGGKILYDNGFLIH